MSSDTPWGRAEEAYKTRYPSKAEAVERSYATFPGLEESEYPAHPTSASDGPASSPESAASEQLLLGRATGFPIIVWLTEEEIALALSEGDARQRISGSRFHDRYGAEKRNQGSSLHRTGRLAECAMRKETGHKSVGVVEDHRTLGGRDVGPFGVRGTFKSYGGLLLHDDDDDKKVYLLVTIELLRGGARCVIVGWLLGRDGKQRHHWNTTELPDPAYLVRQKYLHRDLPEGFYAS